ncbi:hypothetical protein BH20ACT18_BH20ACT18_07060 [soil metagenome]
MLYAFPSALFTDGKGTEQNSQLSAADKKFISEQYRAMTGREPPPSPVSAALYTEHGLPWFDLYEEDVQDVSPSERLAGVDPMADEVEPVEIDPGQVRRIDPGGRAGEH